MLMQGIPWGAAFTFSVPLVTRGGTDYLLNPTLASGDVKIFKDNGASANLTTLPVVTPATTSALVLVSLSAAEMEAGEIVIKFVDQTSPKEWEDQIVIIHTEAKTFGFVTGTVVTDGSNTALTFKTSLTVADDVPNNRLLVFTSGALIGQVQKVSDFVASTDFITVGAAYTTTPSNGDKFILLNR